MNRRSLQPELFFVILFVLLFPIRTFAAGDLVELKGGSGQEIYALLPPDYEADREYPSVYFMPRDGYNAQEYREDKTTDRIRQLESDHVIDEMICVFPTYQEGENLFDQTARIVAAVEERLPVVRDASRRGIIGTGVGGYMAFLLGYSAPDKQLQRKPLTFRAIASHDGDFVSEENPYLSTYGSVYALLKESLVSFGADTGWLGNYYTYMDCSLENPLTWEEGGSADLALAYRSQSLSNPDSVQAWDYSVFEYVMQDPVRYGSWTDHLERSLKGFSDAFCQDGRQTGREETETEYSAKETIVSGDQRRIDLMGDWYFYTQDAILKQNPGMDASNVREVLAENWEEWDIVQPGLDWWTEEFAASLEGNPYYAGYAWYVRSFEVPETFACSGLQINAGMLDEADEVYLNGVRVGQTGIPDEGGSYNGTNPWDEERIYEIPDDLLKAGVNTIAVRMCNGSGAGGWYAGPIQIEARQESARDPQQDGQRYYQTSFRSEALNGQEIAYHVFLPKGYYASDERYPVVYMLHGYGSTGKSFEIAGVPGLLEDWIAAGEIPPCIVIFPSDGHPQKAGWWSGSYARMLNEDLVCQVDSTLRSVDDPRCRFLAGESMGGGGAYLNALEHPELYGGVLDIYGALRYTQALETFLEMDGEALGRLRHFIICGSHDMYSFDLDHIRMGKHLFEQKVPFRFEIDNGEHSSDFYLPRLKDGFSYLLEGAQAAAGEESVGMEAKD